MSPEDGGTTHWQRCLNAIPSIARRPASGNKHHSKGSRSHNGIWQDRKSPSKLHLLLLRDTPTPLATLRNFPTHSTRRIEHANRPRRREEQREALEGEQRTPQAGPSCKPVANKAITPGGKHRVPVTCFSSLASRLRLPLWL